MRRVVLAPDSFKGSIRAADAASALATGWREVDPTADLVLRPMADGGEGTLDAFAAAVPGARRMPVVVSPPWGDSRDGVDAAWLLLPPTPDAPRGTGVVELASTSGIELFGDRREPWHASTVGFGEAIDAALTAGVSRLVLAIGSSASTDGGAGMLAALGARFTTEGDVPASLRSGAVGLRRMTGVDLSGLRPLPPGGATVLTDVAAPLCGPAGAAAVFGPQKGFGRVDIPEIDAILARYAALFEVDPATPGAGAAGGTGFGLLAWGASLVPGAAEVARLIGLADAVAAASLVVTGEGAFDGQSAAGKAPAYVSAVAAALGVPAALVAGRIDPRADTTAFAASVSLTELARAALPGSAGAPPGPASIAPALGPAEAALADPARWLRAAGAALARALS
ncbi:glycerate kinase [Microbacterium sp. SORGH_AS_0888]|uniref:glycerate kinase n=1 Tax=Microbacterium sp. SORGH_AS_0888 TaxID=3041791 RepID=UPI0027D879BB|nr:glycerate kinase [Microbacterium sp. SORGH_AS_0888]